MSSNVSVPVVREQWSLQTLMQLAKELKDAEGMIPKAYVGHPGKILAAMLAGRELGVDPMASLRAFHVVEGKPFADYSFWIARLKQAGYRVRWVASGAERVELELTAPDGQRHVEVWDKDRAVRTGKWNSTNTWKQYPETMLRARAVTSAGRAFAAEVMFGCYEMDEVEEMKPADVTVKAADEAKQPVGPIVTPEERARIDRSMALIAKLKEHKIEQLAVSAAMDAAGVKRGKLTAMSVADLDKLDAVLFPQSPAEGATAVATGDDAAEDAARRST